MAGHWSDREDALRYAVTGGRQAGKDAYLQALEERRRTALDRHKEAQRQYNEMARSGMDYDVATRQFNSPPTFGGGSLGQLTRMNVVSNPHMKDGTFAIANDSLSMTVDDIHRLRMRLEDNRTLAQPAKPKHSFFEKLQAEVDDWLEPVKSLIPKPAPESKVTGWDTGKLDSAGMWLLNHNQAITHYRGA